MSAEIRSHYPSEPVYAQENLAFKDPFPIQNAAMEGYEAVQGGIQNLKTPLKESLQNIAIVRSDVFTDFNYPVYMLGARFSRIAILNQMKANNTPYLEDEDMEFTRSAFMIGWLPHLQPGVYPQPDAVTDYLDKRKENRAYRELLKDQALSIVTHDQNLGKFQPAFIREHEQRTKYIIHREPDFVEVTQRMTKNLSSNVSGSFYSGATDTYFFYKTYFDAVNGEKTA